MISFGGIPLSFMDTPAAVTAARALDGADLFDFAELSGRDSLTFTWPGLPCPRPVQVGSLLWPWAASRFAYAHMLATDAELKLIRPLVYGAKGTAWNPLPLKLDDARTGRSIAPSLYMLPPKPLDQIAGANGLSLLTLVDDRFRWWERAATVTVTPGVTTWAVLIAAIATALGVTITVDAVAAAYLKPAADLAGADVYLPPLLDRVLACVGQRLVRRLDGTVRTQNPTTAKASQDAQLTAYTKEKGGQYLFAAATKPNDLTALVPAQVLVTFPSLPAAAPAPADAPFTETITLASLALPEFAGVTGHAGTKLLHTTAVYDGTNTAEVLALAQQIARDWYRWRLGRQHVRFAGIDPYTPEALNDHVEWLSRGGECSTWVRRGPPWEGESGTAAAPLPYQDSKGSATPMPLPGTDPAGGGGIIGLWFVTPAAGGTPSEGNTKPKIFWDVVTITPVTNLTQVPLTIIPPASTSVPAMVVTKPGDSTKPVVTVDTLDTPTGPAVVTITTTTTETKPAITVTKPGDNTTLVFTVDPLNTPTGPATVTITPPTSVTKPALIVNKPGDSTTAVVTVDPEGTPGTATFLITGPSNSSKPLFDVVVTGTPTGNVVVLPFSIVVNQSGKLILTAATTSTASENLPDGTAPSSPVSGDVWNDGTDLFTSIGGKTTNLTTSPHGTAGNSSFSTSSATYVDVTSASFASMASGVYQIIARVGVSRTPAAAGEQYGAKITDGTTVIDEQAPFCQSQVSGVAVVGEVTLLGYYTASGSPTVKVQVKTSAGTPTFSAQMTYLRVG